MNEQNEEISRKPQISRFMVCFSDVCNKLGIKLHIYERLLGVFSIDKTYRLSSLKATLFAKNKINSTTSEN